MDPRAVHYAARACGWRSEVWFFHPLTSRLLLAAANGFRELAACLDSLRWRDLANPARPAPAVLAEIAEPRSVVGLPRPCCAVVA
jgi:hypothetical protein